MRALGRPSPAAALEPPLRREADPASASYRAEGGSAGWCHVVAATVTGVRHRLAAESNQDCYAWATGEARLAVAVADGLGSVPGSGEASRTAAVAAVRSAARFDGDRSAAAPAAIDAAETALRECGLASGATTLVVCVVYQDGNATLSRVGDSTAFLVGTSDGRGRREVFDAPDEQEGEVAVVTAAITVEDGRAHPAVESAELTLQDGDVLVLVTDGIAGPWRDGPTTVAPAMLDGILSHPSPIELAGLADFSRQGCHDDRTIVCVWLEDLGQRLDPRSAESPSLDHVAAAGDQTGDEDGEGGEDAPAHPGAHEQHEEQVKREHASVGETDDHQPRGPRPLEAVTGESYHPGHAQDDEKGRFPKGDLAQQFDHPHGTRRLPSG